MVFSSLRHNVLSKIVINLIFNDNDFIFSCLSLLFVNKLVVAGADTQDDNEYKY